MLDLVIVVSDLFVSQESPERELPDGVGLPGLHHVARFGTRSNAVGGWRPWLARWLTGHDAGSPATVVANALARDSNVQTARSEAAWMATPVHLVAGLTSLHLDRRSILRLGVEESATLAAEFHRVFHDSGFELCPLESGDFLLFGPQGPLTEIREPARVMGASIADAQRAGALDPTLRRLGAEIEMWLHSHAVNDARQRRGELPVTGLWLWGAGPAPIGAAAHGEATAVAAAAPVATPTAPAAADFASTASTVTAHADAVSTTARDARASDATDATSNNARGVRLSDTASAGSDIAFGSDAYLRGLWSSRGGKVFPLPHQLTDVFSYSHARRAVLVIEIGSLLNSNPTWTFFDAVTQVDLNWISPAVEALSLGKYQRLVMLANDRQWTLRARDRLKFWRRAPPGLSGLQ